jgi:hypothetical protein
VGANRVRCQAVRVVLGMPAVPSTGGGRGVRCAAMTIAIGGAARLGLGCGGSL